MSWRKTPVLLAVERLNDGVIVRFDDGICVFFPTALLYTLSPQARAMDETETVW